MSASLRMPLDEWQESALQAAMGERTDGRWASKFVGISAPRQNGKSQLIVARALAGVLLFGEKTIICSAHQTDTAREVFQRLLDVIEDNPSVERRISAVMKAVNRESITFGRGVDSQVIKVKARVAAGGRGFSSDCLLLDEAQILGKRAWGSIVPTMSARPNPQLWLLGTPPTPEDDAFAFTRMRESSLKHSARHAWLEWAAELADDFDDPDTWAKANPSYGVRISHEACADDRAAMDDEQFALERLGIWRDDLDAKAAIPYGLWMGLADPAVQHGTNPVFAVHVASNRDAWISVLWRRPDDRVQVMLVNDGWPVPAPRMVAECSRLIAKWGGDVVVPPEFEDDFDRAGLNVVKTTASDFAAGCGLVLDAVTAGTVLHGNQSALNTAVRVAVWRSAGAQGERAFQVKDIPEVGPLAAVARGLWGLENYVPMPAIY